MAASQKGTAHLFGTGGTNGNGCTITNATIVSINLSTTFGLNETTANEAGVVIETRRDSRIYGGSVELQPQSGYNWGTVDAGDVIALSGLDNNVYNRNYEVTSPAVVWTAGAKVRVTLQIEGHEGITYT